MTRLPAPSTHPYGDRESIAVLLEACRASTPALRARLSRLAHAGRRLRLSELEADLSALPLHVRRARSGDGELCLVAEVGDGPATVLVGSGATPAYAAGVVMAIHALAAVARAGALSEGQALRLVFTDLEPDPEPRADTVTDPAPVPVSGRPLRDRLWLPLLADARAVVGLGPADDDGALVAACDGTAVGALVALGRAAHAGNHHREGANAIVALSLALEQAVRWAGEADRALRVHHIRGGQSRNTVPDRAEASVWLRHRTPEAAAEGLDHIARLAAEAARQVPGTEIHLERRTGWAPLERTEASGALLETLVSCADASGLAVTPAARSGAGSLVGVAADAGHPAVDGLGPPLAWTEQQVPAGREVGARLAFVARFLAGGG